MLIPRMPDFVIAMHQLADDVADRIFHQRQIPYGKLGEMLFHSNEHHAGGIAGGERQVEQLHFIG
ncbi:hypothetical protein D3C84_758180 [compost metagenome]